MSTLLSALILALSSAGAGDQPAPSGATALRFLPTDRTFAGLSAAAFAQRFYPAEAVEADQAGQATLECEVGADKRPSACRVVEEAPLDFRFGAQSLRMMPHFIVRTVEGRPPQVGERFRYTFQFRPSAPSPTPN